MKELTVLLASDKIEKLTKEDFLLNRAYNALINIEDTKESLNDLVKKVDDLKIFHCFNLSVGKNIHAQCGTDSFGEKYFRMYDLGKDDLGKVIKLKKNFLTHIDDILAKHFGRVLEGRGKIYLISDGEYTKIGATTYDVEKRRNELQTGNAKKLDILGSYNAQRRIATERMLHKRYADKNVLGEWFRLEQDDIYKVLNTREQASENQDFKILTNTDATLLTSNFDSSKAAVGIRKYELVVRFLRKVEPKYLQDFKKSMSISISDRDVYGFTKRVLRNCKVEPAN